MTCSGIAVAQSREHSQKTGGIFSFFTDLFSSEDAVDERVPKVAQGGIANQIICDLNKIPKANLPMLRLQASQRHSYVEKKSFVHDAGEGSALYGMEGLYPDDNGMLEKFFVNLEEKKPERSLIVGLDMPEAHSLGLIVKTIDVAQQWVARGDSKSAAEEVATLLKNFEFYEILGSSWSRFLSTKGTKVDQGIKDAIENFRKDPTKLDPLVNSVEALAPVLKSFAEFHWEEVSKSKNIQGLGTVLVDRIGKDLAGFIKTARVDSLISSLFIEARNEFLAQRIAEAACLAPRKGYRAASFLVGADHMDGLLQVLPKYIAGLKGGQLYKSEVVGGSGGANVFFVPVRAP